MIKIAAPIDARTPSFSRHALMTSIALGTMLCALPANAMDGNTLPENGVVVEGSADVNTAGNYMTIDQHTGRVIIDWDTFNIGENATVEFVQPSSNALAVNRAGDDGDPSKILGTMKSNGRVMVLDRNGVVFGVGSRVDVGSIVASTGDVSNADIMDGDKKITITNMGDGQIVNNGLITVKDGGLAAFVAPTVVNNGIIQAKMGKVALVSGETVTIDLAGDNLISLALDPSNPATKSIVKNNGLINASGGTVLMTAGVAGDAVNSVVNNKGIIRVASFKKSGGKIILEGDNVSSTGAILASGKTAGGTVRLTGRDSVNLEGVVRVRDRTPDPEGGKDDLGRVIVTTRNPDTFTGKDKKWKLPRVDILRVNYTDVPVVPPVDTPTLTAGTFNIEDTFNYNLNRFTPTVGQTGFTITGLPRLAGGPVAATTPQFDINNLNDITPAAGGDTPTAEQVAGIQPAAGGENAACWGDAMNMAAQGQTVTYSFGSGLGDALKDAASCANGI